MTEILNSQQYYKLSENESSEYEFTTDNNVKYKVTFMEDGGDFYRIIHVYASCFIRRNNPNKDKLLNSFSEYINQQF